jgi:hypothetical protein
VEEHSAGIGGQDPVILTETARARRRENLIFKLMIPVIVVVWRDSVATKKIWWTEAKPDICVV